MDKRKVEDNNECFFITPIGSPKSEERELLEALTENVIKPVLKKKNLKLEVAHRIDEGGSIVDQIFTRILNSKLAIVDLTGLNPNVMYELAVRHSFGKPCVVICQDNTNLPFDVLAERTIFYSNSIKGAGELIEELDRKIDFALKNEQDADNPVTRVIQRSRVFENMEQQDSTVLILNELNKLSDRLSRIENKSNSKRISFKKFEQTVRELEKSLGRQPSLAEISLKLDIPSEIMVTYLRIYQKLWHENNNDKSDE
ncbi:hypothetical protein NHG28_06490 [Aerococcaceae bacterium NML201209]|nr:hypothetical protein [Aerococcaceae bacterium NML201209]